MKLLIEIKDNKAPFVLELLRNFSFVKVETLSEEKVTIISDIKESVDDLNLVLSGKKASRNAADFLNEL